ncbi:DUF4097 family beta strand repeat-containing protein [Alteribacillus bidgolensis]|uniref:DUF4097 and DUF4098 domain-containing protein YvlB n=1 Tax=Alteribacillus bidgolensis TaxID=930129 RepID=A0A1G8EFD0_9BACI|nr:DUF4097 family beta strand repeat-containing protein [Alteribacillus bidgolensis]SDH68613.1 DUF4097 and DUF4098 domain-containing protein YvlB [Alteribacillus bidgolensis]
MRRLAGLILVLIGLVILTGSLFANVNQYAPGLGSSTKHLEETLQEADSIQIHALSSDVTIKTHDKDTVSIETSARNKDSDVEISQDNNALTITQPKQHWFSFFTLGKNSNWVVTIPETFKGRLSIKAGSGDFRLENEQEKRYKSIQTNIASGDTYIANMKTEEIDLSAKSGDLTLNDVQTDKAAVETISGNINMNDYSGPLKANVTSGNINVQWKEIKNEVRMNVTSGDVDLQVGEEDVRLDVSVVSGDIRNNVALDTIEQSGNRSLKGKKGAGDVLIHLESVSGNLYIKE